MALVLVGLIPALLEIDSVYAVDSKYTKQKVATQKAIQKADPASAKVIARQGQDSARIAGDSVWQRQFKFMEAVAQHEEARRISSVAERTQKLKEAEASYRAVLDNTPSSAATLNNLAQVLADMNRVKDADKNYQKAIQINDADQGYYRLNYADHLKATDRSTEAKEQYVKVSLEQPNYPRAHRDAVQSILASNRRELAPYLWRLLSSGQHVRARETALAQLADDRWRPQVKHSLLAVVVSALSYDRYAPDDYSTLPVAKTISALTADSALRVPIFELESLHLDTSLSAGDFKWWSRAGRSRRQPPFGVWPYEAFRQLVRSLGDKHKFGGNLERAKSYYFTAAWLNPRQVDPEAFIKLADLYLSQNQVDSLSQLVREFEEPMFQAKGEAYSHSQLRQIYEFHRALGIVYAQIERWGDESTATSAIFQLERALQTAERLNALSQTPEDSVHVEPRLPELLARAQEAAGP